ncbi:hypothetical protein M0805_001265 [Coniferiporia weirii]|nr:hypothetical protein M0805_001265 [Coniferiporia weirii]
MASLVDYVSATQLLSPLDLETRVENLTDLLEATDPDSNPFARGGFSQVFLYQARNFIPGILTAGDIYAVKMPRYYAGSQGKENDRLIRKLKREIITWIPLRHPNVLRLRGVMYTDDNPFPCLVSDFMESGTAVEYVSASPQPSLIHILRGVAMGLSYMHSRNVAHGDVKGNNVFVTKSGDAVVGDFGLSRTLRIDGTATTSTSGLNGTIRWTAVEYIDSDNGPKVPTKAGDVWSYGCTALQLLSGLLPYYDVDTDARVVVSLSRGELPKIPHSLERSDFETYKEGIVGLCYMCWVKNPKHRPNIDMIASIINSFGLSIEPSRSAAIVDNACNEVEGHSSAYPKVQSIVVDGGDDGSLGMPSISHSSYESEHPHPPSFINDAEGQQTGAARSTESGDTDPAALSLTGETSSRLPMVQSIEFALNPWSTIPPPPLPSVENMLKHYFAKNVLSDKVLDRKLGIPGLQYKFSENSGSSRMSNFAANCLNLFASRELGKELVKGNEMHRDEFAAWRVAETLLREGVIRAPTLCYLPILEDHIGQYPGFEWSPPVTNKGGRVYRMTLKLNGVVLGVGAGPTQKDAQEKAARNAATVWRSDFADSL